LYFVPVSGFPIQGRRVYRSCCPDTRTSLTCTNTLSERGGTLSLLPSVVIRVAERAKKALPERIACYPKRSSSRYSQQYASGDSTRVVAASHGVSKSKVISVLKQHGDIR